MKTDLISREALKKEFCKDVMGGLNWERIINNAPTVEPTFGLFRAMVCETCQAYAVNTAIAKLADEYTKTRGAWRIVNPYEPDYKKGKLVCTHCNEQFNYADFCNIAPVKCFPNFCPNCGADMREEGDT